MVLMGRAEEFDVDRVAALGRVSVRQHRTAHTLIRDGGLVCPDVRTKTKHVGGANSIEGRRRPSRCTRFSEIATDARAREEIWPHYQAMMTRIGAERGWPPVSRLQFEREVGPDGSLYVGAPDTVAAKIAATVRTLGLARFDMKYSNGALPHGALLSSIELYGTRVVPRVRELLAGS